MFGISIHYGIFFRLRVRSQSLDIVYNPGATQWLASFLAGPHQHRINLPTKSKIGADFMKNWEQILEGDAIVRLCHNFLSIFQSVINYFIEF